MKFFINVGSSIINFLEETGRFFIFTLKTLKSIISKWYLKNIFQQMISIGYLSLPVVALTSFFTGGALAIQIYYGGNQFNSEVIVSSIVALGITRELGPVLGGIVVAGRVSAAIAAEIGTMKVTEQIDALEVMGINSINYLVFPKVIALLLYPFLISIAMFLGILGGMAACVYGGYSTMSDFIDGIQTDFIPFHMTYAFIKTFVFAFILATVPSFHGYYMKGGALEVGKASTTSFIWTCVTIIIFNFLITQMLLG